MQYTYITYINEITHAEYLINIFHMVKIKKNNFINNIRVQYNKRVLHWIV